MKFLQLFFVLYRVIQQRREDGIFSFRPIVVKCLNLLARNSVWIFYFLKKATRGHYKFVHYCKNTWGIVILPITDCLYYLWLNIFVISYLQVFCFVITLHGCSVYTSIINDYLWLLSIPIVQIIISVVVLLPCEHLYIFLYRYIYGIRPYLINELDRYLSIYSLGINYLSVLQQSF